MVNPSNDASRQPEPDNLLLGVFAKYWEPGKVKTRLAQSIGNQLAAQVYRQFIDELAKGLEGSGDQRCFCISPPGRESDFEDSLPAGWQVCLQAEGDLGQRMAEFFRSSFESAATQVILIGSDSPWINPAIIEQAQQILVEHQVVLGPCFDGGYYLIGMSEYLPQIFESVDWSTEHVLRQTIEQLDSHGYSFGQLDFGNDIDDLADLKEFVDEFSISENVSLSQSGTDLMKSVLEQASDS